MKNMEISWKIKPNPILINISGSRGSLKMYNAYLLAKEILENLLKIDKKSKLNILLFFSGNLHSIFLNLIMKKYINGLQENEDKSIKLLNLLNQKKEKKEIIKLFKDTIKEFEYNKKNYQLKPSMFYLLDEDNVNDFDLRQLINFSTLFSKVGDWNSFR